MKLFMFVRLACCLLALPVFSQPALTPLQQKITQSLDDYFKLDRENIHLHFNKNIYLSNDRIWFKGYVVEKKNRPTQTTTNIYLNLLDGKGQKIATQLYFAENGLFDGYLNVPDDIVSGNYFIQAYTNFMNNFSEDESAVYPITLLNTKDKSFGWQRKINYDQLDVEFYPESGVFLEGASNTIGLHIADCSGLGVGLKEIEVLDSNNNMIATASTNEFGYGRFDIYNATRQSYRIRFKANGAQQERTLPMPSATGANFSVNNYIHPEKIAIKVRTNAATPQAPLTLVIQQNDAVVFADVHFSLGTFEQNIIIPREQIPAGLNMIYLIDSNLKPLAQRVIYDPIAIPAKSLLNIVGKGTNEIKITGASAIRLGTLSVSVLPAESVNQQPTKPIQASMAFDTYLAKPIEHLDYYLADFNSKKHYELDHILITEKSKYDWEKMLLPAPVKKYDSDFGLAVKGTVNTEDKKNTIYKINMQSSALGFDEFTSLDAKNEFVFKNLMAIDSAKIYFLPKDKAGKILPHRMSFRIIDNNRRLIKPFSPPQKICLASPVYERALAFPKIENSILLDSVNVVAQKDKLKYRNRMGNMTARSFKITENDATKTLLSFISANGFIVSRKNGSIWVASRMPSPSDIMRAPAGPTRITNSGPIDGKYTPGAVVFIDDIIVPNYDLLDTYSMVNIDEIYLNKHATDISRYGTNGIIKIYTKRSSEFVVSPTGSPAIVIKNGFQKPAQFQNPKYDNVREDGFQKLGTVYWNPIVETDENGTFKLSVPNLYQKALRIVIEGVDADGTMISESHLLPIE